MHNFLLKKNLIERIKIYNFDYFNYYNETPLLDINIKSFNFFLILK